MALTFPELSMNFAFFPWHMIYNRYSVTPGMTDRVWGVRGEGRNSRQSKGLMVSKGGVLGRMKWAPWTSFLILSPSSFPQHSCAHSFIKLFSLLEMFFFQLFDELLLILQNPTSTAICPEHSLLLLHSKWNQSLYPTLLWHSPLPLA